MNSFFNFKLQCLCSGLKAFHLEQTFQMHATQFICKKLNLNILEIYYHSNSKVIALKPADEIFTDSAIKSATSNCEDHLIKFKRYRRELETCTQANLYKNVHSAKMLWYVLLIRGGHSGRDRARFFQSDRAQLKSSQPDSG